MPKIQANGINLHYLQSGRGEDLVMLHGFLGNQAVWHLQIVPQLRSRFMVTTYDLRGHGYSELTPSGYTAQDLAEDLRRLLDELEIESAHLVGHSYGADVAMYFSLLYPKRVKRLVALEPGLAALVHQRRDRQWDGWAYWVEKLESVGVSVPPDKRSDLEYLITLSLETPKFYGPARGLPRNREPLLRLIRETTLIADYEFVGDLSLESIPLIQTPTLLVYGEHSHFLGSYEYLKDALPNVTPVILPGGEHFGPLEQPDRLVEEILAFTDPASADESRQAPDGSPVEQQAAPPPGSA